FGAGMKILICNEDYELSGISNVSPDDAEELKLVLQLAYTYDSAVIEGNDAAFTVETESDAVGLLYYKTGYDYGFNVSGTSSIHTSSLDNDYQAALLVADGEEVEINNLAGEAIVNVAVGKLYEFPCLAADGFDIPELNKNVDYNTNVSDTGHFLGRSVVRKGGSASLQPIDFRADTGRLWEIREMLELMHERP